MIIILIIKKQEQEYNTRRREYCRVLTSCPKMEGHMDLVGFEGGLVGEALLLVITLCYY